MEVMRLKLWHPVLQCRSRRKGVGLGNGFQKKNIDNLTFLPLYFVKRQNRLPCCSFFLDFKYLLQRFVVYLHDTMLVIISRELNLKHVENEAAIIKQDFKKRDYSRRSGASGYVGLPLAVEKPVLKQ